MCLGRTGWQISRPVFSISFRLAPGFEPKGRRTYQSPAGSLNIMLMPIPSVKWMFPLQTHLWSCYIPSASPSAMGPPKNTRKCVGCRWKAWVLVFDVTATDMRALRTHWCLRGSFSRQSVLRKGRSLFLCEKGTELWNVIYINFKLEVICFFISVWTLPSFEDFKKREDFECLKWRYYLPKICVLADVTHFWVSNWSQNKTCQKFIVTVGVKN